MKDNLLFEYIRNAVKQKTNVKPQKNTNFAERYCKQQLIKKKLNKHNPHQKMTLLMNNFRDLDTYVNLPDLIDSVKKWKFRQIEQPPEQPKPSIFIRPKITDPSLNNKIKKQLGQRIKEKYLNENALADQVLQFLEQHTSIRSDGLKNCSYSNLNNLFEQVCQQGDDQTWKGNFDFLEALHKASQAQKFNQQKLSNLKALDQKLKGSELNSKPRREITKLLHKVTTYLQIILETEHKQKWTNKKYTHRPHYALNTTNMDMSQVQKDEKDKEKSNQSMFPPANSKLINLSDLKQAKIKKYGKNSKQDKENKSYVSKTMRMTDSSNKPFMRKMKKQLTDVIQIQSNGDNDNKNFSYAELPKVQKVRTKMNDSSPDLKRANLHKSLHCEAQKQVEPKTRNDSFSKTTSSFKFRTEVILNQFPPQNKVKKFNSLLKQPSKEFDIKMSKQAVKQNFTFRNRIIKQKIVNKISGFIRQIDQEEHNNRKQNHYYNTAINKLENTLAMCFGQFRQEAVAGDADIQNLKSYATHHNHNGPIPILSSSTYGQLMQLNQGGLFALSSNDAKLESYPEFPSNLDFNSFRFQVQTDASTNN